MAEQVPLASISRGRRPGSLTKLKQTAVSRVLKGAADAGIVKARLELDPHTGKMNLFIGADDGDTPENLLNQL
jgi:hypothetical protein